MLAWLSENLATILVGLAVLALLLAIVFHMIRQKKQGKTSCGCGCEGCAMKDSCHPQKDQKQEK